MVFLTLERSSAWVPSSVCGNQQSVAFFFLYRTDIENAQYWIIHEEQRFVPHKSGGWEVQEHGTTAWRELSYHIKEWQRVSHSKDMHTCSHQRKIKSDLVFSRNPFLRKVALSSDRTLFCDFFTPRFHPFMLLSGN